MIGEKIKELRIERGITQRELATLSGLSLGAIQGYEQNRYKPKIEQLTKIANVFHVSPSSLADEQLRNEFIKGWRSDIYTGLDAFNISNKELSTTFWVALKELLDADMPIETLEIYGDLLTEIHQLNDEGKTKVISYAIDLVSSNLYKNS